jgi:hypothetical protein
MHFALRTIYFPATAAGAPAAEQGARGGVGGAFGGGFGAQAFAAGRAGGSSVVAFARSTVRIQLCNTAAVPLVARIRVLSAGDEEEGQLSGAGARGPAVAAATGGREGSAAGVRAGTAAGGPASGASSDSEAGVAAAAAAPGRMAACFAVKRAHRTVTLRPRSFVMLPVAFCPGVAGVGQRMRARGLEAQVCSALLVVHASPDPAAAAAGSGGAQLPPQQLRLLCKALLVGEAVL